METPTAPAPGEPGGGATDDADPAAPYTPVTKDAVALDQPAAFGSAHRENHDGRVRRGRGANPGEVAGPAVRVTVRLTNGTSAAVPLDSAVVSVYGGRDLARRPPHRPGRQKRVLAGSVAPGASVTGVYVFNVPADQRDRLQVTVVAVTVTTVLFEGAGTAWARRGRPGPSRANLGPGSPVRAGQRCGVPRTGVRISPPVTGVFTLTVLFCAVSRS